MQWTISRLIGVNNAFSLAIIIFLSVTAYISGSYQLRTFDDLNKLTNLTTNLAKLQSETLDLTHSKHSYILSQQSKNYKEWRAVFNEINLTVNSIEPQLNNRLQKSALVDFTLAHFEYGKAFEEIHLFLQLNSSENIIITEEVLSRGQVTVSLRKTILLSRVMVEAIIDLMDLNEQEILANTEIALEQIHISFDLMLFVFCSGVVIVSLISYRTYINAKNISESLINTSVSRDEYKEARDQAKASELLAKLRTTDLEEINVKLSFQGKELKRINKELIAAQEQLVQSAKLASIGEISAGLAHELNQPLGTIQMTAEIMLLLINTDEVDQEKMTDKLKIIIEQVERASKIINHLKVFSRQGKKDLGKVDVNWLIDQAFVLFQESLKIQGIKLKKELAEGLPQVTCDLIKIEQVLTNLFINARDALEDTVEKTITVRSYENNQTIQIEVEDTGCGMPKSVIDKVFDPFFTTKAVGKGTGLGMSISYGILKDHNGALSVISQEGHGTCFTISLPVI